MNTELEWGRQQGSHEAVQAEIPLQVVHVATSISDIFNKI